LSWRINVKKHLSPKSFRHHLVPGSECMTNTKTFQWNHHQSPRESVGRDDSLLSYRCPHWMTLRLGRCPCCIKRWSYKHSCYYSSWALEYFITQDCMSAEIIFLERIVKRSVDEGERGRGGDTIGNKWGTSFTPPFFKFWRFYCIDPPPPHHLPMHCPPPPLNSWRRPWRGGME